MPGESLWVAYGYANSDCYGISYCHSYCDGNSHSERHSHSYADGFTNTDPVRRKMHSDAAASSDSSSSPIAPVAASLCEAQTCNDCKRG